MSKFLYLITVLLFAGAPVLGQTVIVPIATVSQETLQDLMEGDSEDMVLECAEGSTLPLKLFISGDVIETDEDSPLVSLRVLQTFYIKVQDSGFLFSRDGRDWLSLLEFVTGTASLGLGMDASQPVAQAGMDLYLKD